MNIERESKLENTVLFLVAKATQAFTPVLSDYHGWL